VARREGASTTVRAWWKLPPIDIVVKPRRSDRWATASSSPLARSGASTWTPKEREAYANDVDEPRALIAVSAASNRSKADKDPTQWRPPYAGYWCAHVTSWIADKTRYQLTVTPAEQTALAERLAICPAQPITLAR
jgi:hypothetical protein